jgi:hypothetical protein
MNQSLEIEVIKRFVIKEKQSRYIQFVNSEKTQDKFIFELPHFNHFKWEMFDELHKNEAAEIKECLHALKIKINNCYVISENPEIDQKIIHFEEALQEIGCMGTILIFEEARLIYYEGEPPKNRYISKIL